MIVVFEIRDDMLAEETVLGLIQKSFFWDLSTKWVMGPGTIETNVITTPIPDTEGIDDSTDESTETNHCDSGVDPGSVPDLRLDSDDEGQPTTPTQHTETQEGTGQDPV